MAARPPRNPAHLAVLLDSLPDALLLVDAAGMVVDANATARTTFRADGTHGLNRQGRALVGRRLNDLLPGFDPAVRAAAPGAVPAVARALDGADLPVELFRASVPWGPGAQHLMLLLRPAPVDGPATGNGRTEALLRATEEAVFGLDGDGLVVLANPAAARLLGTRVGEIAGRDLHALALHTRADGTPYEAEDSPLADTLRTGSRHRRRREVVWRADGGTVPVELSTVPVRDGDRVVGAVVTCADVSRLVEAERRHGRLLEVLDGEVRAGLAALGAAVAEPAAASVRHLLALVDSAVGREPARPVSPPPASASAGRIPTPALPGARSAAAHGRPGVTSAAELPFLTILGGGEPDRPDESAHPAQHPAAQHPVTPPDPADPAGPAPELLVWPALHHGTSRALARRGWWSMPIVRAEELAGRAGPRTAALLIDPLTGPVTRRALAQVRAAAAAEALPVLVVAGIGEVDAEAARGAADPALLLSALWTGHEAARVLVIDPDPAVSGALAASLARAGMEPTQARSESEAMLRAAISPPDLVLLGLAVEPGGRPGIVDWLRNAERLVSTAVVAYATDALDPGHQGRLALGTTALAVQARTEGAAVEARLVDLVLRLAAPR